MSRRSTPGDCMLGAMLRLPVEVRGEDEAPLQRMAFEGHRTVREQASYLLHLKIQEEIARLNLEPGPVAEVA